MADGTAALLRQRTIEGADLFGYSDRGNVALGIGIGHPDLVRKPVVAAVFYTNDRLSPEILEFLKHATPEDLGGELRHAYTRVAPNPEDWPTLVAKVTKLGPEFKGWWPEDIQSINTPATVIVGDADIVRPEHAVQMFRLLPHAQLAVLQGTDHWAPVQRPDWIVLMIKAFLDAPMLEAKRSAMNKSTRKKLAPFEGWNNKLLGVSESATGVYLWYLSLLPDTAPIAMIEYLEPCRNTFERAEVYFR